MVRADCLREKDPGNQEIQAEVRNPVQGLHLLHKGPATPFWRSKTYSYADDRSHNAFDLCGDGKIIGEFVCDRVYQYTTSNMTDGVDIEENEVVSQSCLSRKELDAYEHSAEPKENCIYLVGLYCWHITDLKIYAQPEDLFITQGLKRAPQSWRYVEEVGPREY